MASMLKVVALAGGVGGARLVDGLAQLLAPENLTVVVNTGDDFDLFGLRICPDLDTVCYTLSQQADSVTGWGRKDETWNAYETIKSLGGPTWFRLGDKDLGTHLERTRRLAAGERLSAVMRDFCKCWQVPAQVLPMSDEPVSTFVITSENVVLPFQEYFVKYACEPVVKGFEFRGSESARPAPGVHEALRAADCVIICPSNPWVSITPILSIRGIIESLADKKVVAVSPIIGGKTVKGPAAKMYRELGIKPTASAVAYHYREFLSGFVLDRVDSEQAGQISAWNIIPLVTHTIMGNRSDRKRLAQEVLEFCERLGG